MSIELRLGDLAMVTSLNRILGHLSRSNQEEPPGADPSPALQKVGYDLTELIPGEAVAALETEATRFQNQFKEVTKTKQNQRQATERAAERLEELARCIRDAWEALRRRNARRNLPSSVLAFYLMVGGRGVRVNGSRRKWLALAEGVLKGDSRAESAGYPLMQNPDAGEVRTCLERARQALAELDEVANEHQKARDRLAEIRPAVYMVYRRTAGHIRAALADRPGANRRGIMRLMGFVFRNDPNNPIEEQEPPIEATPAPAQLEVNP